MKKIVLTNLLMMLAFGLVAQTTTSMDKDGNLLKNGNPYFPFGCYGLFYTNSQEDKIRSIKELYLAGMNSIYMTNADNSAGQTGFLNLLDTCAKYEVDVVMGASNNSFLKYRANQCKSKPALFGYTLADDADDPSKTSIEECKTVQQEIRVADPNRVTHLTLTGWSADRRNKAAEFIAISDFCSYQIYPICKHRYADFTSTNSLSETYKRTLAYVLEAEKVNKPFVMLPQTFSWGGQSNSPCYPTVAELRNMVYSGLAAGVKGVVSYDFSFDLINNQKALWKEYSDLRKDAQKVESYLLNSKVKRQNTGDTELIYSYWERGDTTLVVVVNASYSITKTLNLALNKNYGSPKIQNISNRYAETPQIIANKIAGNLQAMKVMMFKLYNDIPTSISELAVEGQISAYPNPANENLNLQGSQITKGMYEISNPEGKILQVGILTVDQCISIQNLHPGIYLLKIKNEIKAQMLRFVKQ